MDVCVGDTVMVNAAAFIASRRRNSESLRCEVLGVEGARVFVQTNHPYRVFKAWVSVEWIENAMDVSEGAAR